MTETKKLGDEQVKYMVDRFLGWRLPENFNPDGGVNFEPVGNKGTSFEYKRQPTGTNLLDAIQAEAMVRYMTDWMPVAAPSPATEQKCPKCGNQMLEEIIADAQVREQHQDALVAAAYQVASQEAYDWEPACPPPPEDEAANGQWRIGRAVARDISHSIKSCTPDRARAALEEEVRKARIEALEEAVHYADCGLCTCGAEAIKARVGTERHYSNCPHGIAEWIRGRIAALRSPG